MYVQMNKSLSNLQCLFFDLDGTLYGLAEDAFLNEYPKLVLPHFMDVYKHEEFLEYFWKATQLLMTHNDQSTHVIESFFTSFNESSKMPREEIMERFDRFYASDFKKLKLLSKEYPETNALIEMAKEKNIKLILATNPIFPEVATRERCKWANINYEDFFYVSHAENSTSCKPNPNYYLELLQIAEVDPINSLMVGNDYLYDMSASSVGITTWMIDKNQDNVAHKGKFKVDFEGSLETLLQIITEL
jgi:FMN phosphatase YigB (HAD superfamily)